MMSALSVWRQCSPVICLRGLPRQGVYATGGGILANGRIIVALRIEKYLSEFWTWIPMKGSNMP